MSYPRIHRKIFNDAWLIEPAAYDAIRNTFLAHCARLADSSAAPKAADSAEPSAQPSKPYAVLDGVAIVPLRGIIGKRLSMLEMFCGGCDVDTFAARLQMAYDDAEAHTILIDVDSPGGTVTGVPEAAALVARLADAGGKEIVSYTETLNASAAYYISSQAHRVFASPSSSTGSIGVVITVANQAEYDKKLGVEYTTITTGKFKDLGNPHRAMTDDEQKLLQAEAFELFHDFADAVAHARGVTRSHVEALEARVFRGDEAVARGLVDGLADTRAALLRRLS